VNIRSERTTVDSLSLREVARRADLTPGALYRYFDSRQYLLAALFERALVLLLTYIEPAVARGRGVERLRTVGEAYLPTWPEYVQAARPVTLLVEAIRDDVAAGLLVLPEGLDESGLAYAFWSLLHGMAELQRAHLRDVIGEFEGMQRAALEHFLAPLASTRSTKGRPNRGKGPS
jgi:AcrR family transcriptional regulator